MVKKQKTGPSHASEISRETQSGNVTVRTTYERAPIQSLEIFRPPQEEPQRNTNEYPLLSFFQTDLFKYVCRHIINPRIQAHVAPWLQQLYLANLLNTTDLERYQNDIDVYFKMHSEFRFSDIDVDHHRITALLIGLRDELKRRETEVEETYILTVGELDNEEGFGGTMQAQE